MKRKYKIKEMEFFNNVELPVDKQNKIIDRLTYICIMLGVVFTMYSLQTLYIVIKHYYLIEYLKNN